MGIELFVGATKTLKVMRMRDDVPPSYAKPMNPSRKRIVKKEDGTEAKEDLEDKEYHIQRCNCTSTSDTFKEWWTR